MNHFNKKLMAVLTTAILFVSCAQMQQALQYVNIQEPRVSLKEVQITGLSFDDLSVLFDLEINNPNPVGVHLQGFNYDFWLNGGSFIKGDQDQGLDIAANATSKVSLPITLSFAKIYDLYHSVKTQDEMDYVLQGGLNFDLPVLGVIRVPYKTDGKLPVLKFPSIHLQSIKIKKIGLTKVTLEARLNLQNPNAFGLYLDRLKYALSINGREWLQGMNSGRIDLMQKEQTRLNLPVELDVLNMGRAVLDLIENGAKVDYELNAGAVAGSSLSFFKSQPIQLKQNGQVSILK